jgi:hypothetical protein
MRALKEFSAWVPVAISATCIIMVWQFLTFGGMLVHDQDEGFGARMFQLLITIEIPIIGYFVFTWHRRELIQTVRIFSLQIVALILAIAPVFIFQL